MKEDVIHIDNLKCGGCANTISKKLEALPEVQAVAVDVEDSTVAIRYQSEQNLHNRFLKILAKSGYPEAGTSTSVQKMKSYVSCALGKFS